MMVSSLKCNKLIMVLKEVARLWREQSEVFGASIFAHGVAMRFLVFLICLEICCRPSCFLPERR